MINKRLLIKNLLAHNSENSFYDKKRQVNLGEKEGKAKILKHVCALANSNPHNNSYIVIGVEDADNSISGVDFFDDSKIQNLVNAYLKNPPLISYENIPFPHLPKDLVVGLISIKPIQGELCSLQKNIWKYPAGAVFVREGSISLPLNSLGDNSGPNGNGNLGYGSPATIQADKLRVNSHNQETVAAIEAHSQNNMELTLDGVFDFFRTHEDLQPSYKVFKEYFVVCWSGKRKKTQDKEYYSRVDIALINEQVKLFYSELDEVSITHTSDNFRIVEYVRLGLNRNSRYYPLEEVNIRFRDNATYHIESKLLFEPPQFEKKNLYHFYNSNNALIEKLKTKVPLTAEEEKDLHNVPATYLICYFNGFDQAIEKLEEARPVLREHDRTLFQLYKDSLRILRKVKYN